MKTPLSIIAAAAFSASILVGGCGEQDSDGPVQSQTPAPPTHTEGIALMGLVDGLTLQYLQTDTVILIDSVYSVSVSTTTLKIEVSGSGPEYLISSDRVKWMNYRSSDHNILFNGYWKTTFSRDSLYFFPEPPSIMPRRVIDSVELTGFTPAYGSDATRIFYNSYFGFFFSKKFVRKTRLSLPAGEFDCFQFDVQLFTDQSMKNPLILVSEYYSVGLGLVKQTLVGGSLKRTLSLTKYVQPPTN